MYIHNHVGTNINFFGKVFGAGKNNKLTYAITKNPEHEKKCAFHGMLYNVPCI